MQKLSLPLKCHKNDNLDGIMDFVVLTDADHAGFSIKNLNTVSLKGVVERAKVELRIHEFPFEFSVYFVTFCFRESEHLVPAKNIFNLNDYNIEEKSRPCP